jgi:hypothetical protein
MKQLMRRRRSMGVGRHGHFVPEGGTNVGFTAETDESSLCSSSSGGGLFGRPMTREGQGALLNFGPYRCLGVWSFFKDDSDCGTVSIL